MTTSTDITEYEINEKKMIYFKSVLESIVELSDAASSNDIGQIARKALEEPFCDCCGTHPALNGCDCCGRDLCDVCVPENANDKCAFCIND